MRLTTWNVNGIRNPFSYQPWRTSRTFPAMFDILESDIIVMQELKIQRKDLRDDMVLLDGWDCYFSLPKHKKGYSGVGIYTRNSACAPIRAEEGLLGVLPSPSGTPYRDLPETQSIGGYPSPLQVAELGVDALALDAEGRCVVLEFPAFVLFGVYSPANSNGLRDDFRYGFNCALDYRIRNLVRQGKQVILVGDLNVVRDERDSAGAAEEMRKNGESHEQFISTPCRRIFNQLLIGGDVFGERDEGREEGVLQDTCREFHPREARMYTHWDTKINARPGNFGSRIDFVLASREIRRWVNHANRKEGLHGSDHCPVYADFSDTLDVRGEMVNFMDIMNPVGTFQNGSRKIDWKLQNTPLFSAKRLPEFDKRRSIMSMFAAPSMKKSQSNHAECPQSPEAQRPATEAQVGTISSEAREGLGHGLANGTADESNAQAQSKKRVALSSLPDVDPKRQKLDTQISTTKGQQSLKGFFQASNKSDHAKSPRTKGSGDISTDTARNLQASPRSSQRRQSGNGSCEKVDASPTPEPTIESSETYGTVDSLSPDQVASQIAASEKTQRSWNTIFTKPAAPLCEEHDEPCKSMLTKKKGSNQGRSFWMCARPLGPSGNKERGTQWRCPTFIWCSDWGGMRRDIEMAKGDAETMS